MEEHNEMFIFMKTILEIEGDLKSLFKKKADIKLSEIPEDHEMRNHFSLEVFYNRLLQFCPSTLDKIKLNQILPIIIIADRPAIPVMVAYDISRDPDNIDNYIKNIFTKNKCFDDILKNYERKWDKQKITDMDIIKKYNTDNLLDTPLGWLF